MKSNDWVQARTSDSPKMTTEAHEGRKRRKFDFASIARRPQTTNTTAKDKRFFAPSAHDSPLAPGISIARIRSVAAEKNDIV